MLAGMLTYAANTIFPAMLLLRRTAVYCAVVIDRLVTGSDAPCPLGGMRRSAAGDGAFVVAAPNMRGVVAIAAGLAGGRFTLAFTVRACMITDTARAVYPGVRGSHGAAVHGAGMRGFIGVRPSRGVRHATGRAFMIAGLLPPRCFVFPTAVLARKATRITFSCCAIPSVSTSIAAAETLARAAVNAARLQMPTLAAIVIIQRHILIGV